MRRWHQDFTITRWEWKKHRRMHVESNKDFGEGRDPYQVDCECDAQVGRFRKKDAYDCGKPHCGICHGDKYPKRALHEQELVSDLDFKEQLQEVWSSGE